MSNYEMMYTIIFSTEVIINIKIIWLFFFHDIFCKQGIFKQINIDFSILFLCTYLFYYVFLLPQLSLFDQNEFIFFIP